jgi:hypothetical protein
MTSNGSNIAAATSTVNNSKIGMTSNNLLQKILFATSVSES